MCVYADMCQSKHQLLMRLCSKFVIVFHASHRFQLFEVKCSIGLAHVCTVMVLNDAYTMSYDHD